MLSIDRQIVGTCGLTQESSEPWCELGSWELAWSQKVTGRRAVA